MHRIAATWSSASEAEGSAGAARAAEPIALALWRRCAAEMADRFRASSDVRRVVAVLLSQGTEGTASKRAGTGHRSPPGLGLEALLGEKKGRRGGSGSVEAAVASGLGFTDGARGVAVRQADA